MTFVLGQSFPMQQKDKAWDFDRNVAAQKEKAC